MEKRFKFSDTSSKTAKIVYAIVIAILCVSAIVIGIVAANNRKSGQDREPPQNDLTDQGGNENKDDAQLPDDSTGDSPDVKLGFISPVKGTVIKSHSATVPVFSNTLEEWRIHTGVDISCEEGAEVVAAEAGQVVAIYYHPMKGKIIEISHSLNHKTLYCNLNEESVTLSVGDRVEAGDVIGRVGDSAVSELAEEPHLHFEMMVNDTAVNPLDYIGEDSKREDLGIVSENIA